MLVIRNSTGILEQLLCTEVILSIETRVFSLRLNDNLLLHHHVGEILMIILIIFLKWLPKRSD